MQIQFFCPRWGSETVAWESFCAKVKEAGYDGVETSIPFDEREKEAMAEALDKHSLLLIGQYYQSFEKSFAEHVTSFEKHLENIASLKPVKIDSQTGKDYYTVEQNAELFWRAATFTAQTGIEICHETHRNKALFAAHVSRHYLRHIPSLCITADFSHWCCVAESLLEDQEEAVSLACMRSYHIHARVGHAQSAQVVDPRLPAYQTEWNTHLAWWDQIVAARRKDRAMLTITPEFGPAPYLVHLPGTNQPIADQWELNAFILHSLKKRYNS